MISDCWIAQDDCSHCHVRGIKPRMIRWMVTCSWTVFPAESLQTRPNRMELHPSTHARMHSLNGLCCQAWCFAGGRGVTESQLTGVPHFLTLFPEDPLSTIRTPKLLARYPNGVWWIQKLRPGHFPTPPQSLLYSLSHWTLSDTQKRCWTEGNTEAREGKSNSTTSR